MSSWRFGLHGLLLEAADLLYERHVDQNSLPSNEPTCNFPQIGLKNHSFFGNEFGDLGLERELTEEDYREDEDGGKKGTKKEDGGELPPREGFSSDDTGFVNFHRISNFIFSLSFDLNCRVTNLFASFGWEILSADHF